MPRVQIRLDEESWARAERAMRLNGLTAVSKLCEMLLHREYVRLGIDVAGTEGTVEDLGEEGEEEHRIQVRVREKQWGKAQELAAEMGFEAVSDLCRHLLEEAFKQQAARAQRKKGARSKGSARK